MRYGSICSGIEAASVAFAPLGWTPVFFAEIEPFCCAVLQHHYPTVPNVGDFTPIGTEVSVGAIDLLIGGTPCQSFSVAGQRRGLDDPRGNLTLEYFALADRLRPRWLVWENVPGLLSDDNGRTFGTCLGLLAECGYGFAYRVLDAQYAGVPQRRSRVFLVAYLGDWRPPAAVLLERHSLQGHPAPRRETGQSPAACLRSGPSGGRSHGKVNGTDRSELVTHTLRADGFDASEDGIGRGTPLVTQPGDVMAFEWQAAGGHGMQPSSECPTLGRSKTPAICFSESGQGWWADGIGALRESQACKAVAGVAVNQEEVAATQRSGGDGGAPSSRGEHLVLAFTERTRADGRHLETQDALAYCLTNPGSGGRPHSKLIQDIATMVRRLTPRECERLQGLPDDWTMVPYRGKPAKDAPRYKAIGNSFAVPVVRWIGTRLQQVETVLRTQERP